MTALPHNLDAERAVLGVLLYDAAAFPLVRDVLTAEAFHETLHGRVYEAVVTASEAGRAPEPTLIAERLRADEALIALGGRAYLVDLVDQAPALGTVRQFAEVIADTALRRRLIEMAEAALVTAREPANSGYEAILVTRAALETAEQGAAPEDAAFIDARDAAAARMIEIDDEIASGKPKGPRSGLACIDHRLGGLLPESLVVIAGRPGMGKTALLGNVMAGAAFLNPDRLFACFSLEMGNGQLSDRLLSRMTCDDDMPVKFGEIAQGKLTALDQRRLHEVSGRAPRNLLLRDRGNLGLQDVQRAVWALKRRGKLSAIGIDYLQLMRRPEGRGRNEASVIAEITAGLKQLAREAKITIVLLSQLNRSVEQRDDKRPMLSDLRESGAIEQDADAVLFPFREVYYLQKAEPREGSEKRIEWELQVEGKRRLMEVIVAKNRHGAEGIARQDYRAEVDHIQNEERP